MAYSIDGEELAVQPAEELVDSTLAIHEEGLQSIPLGAFGWVRPFHRPRARLQPTRHGTAFTHKGLESRHLESRPKASARLDLEVSARWASPLSRGLWGGRRSAALHRRC